MKAKLYLMLCCIVLSGLLSCEKDEPPKTAPPITQENTFSCKINGELFIPEPHGWISAPGIQLVSHTDDSWLFILGNGRIDIYVYIHQLTSTGEYIITQSDGNDNFSGETENLVEMTDDYVPGVNYISINNNDIVTVLELELDTRFILQFDEITLVNNSDPTDILILSEGKLNVNLDTLEY